MIARTSFKIASEELKIVLDEDGTEIVDDDYLHTLDNNTMLMVLKNTEQWVSHSSASDSRTVKTSRVSRPHIAHFSPRPAPEPGMIQLNQNVYNEASLL